MNKHLISIMCLETQHFSSTTLLFVDNSIILVPVRQNPFTANKVKPACLCIAEKLHPGKVQTFRNFVEMNRKR